MLGFFVLFFFFFFWLLHAACEISVPGSGIERCPTVEAWSLNPWSLSESESCSLVSDSLWNIQSVEFSRPEYWSGLPFPSPGDVPNPGIEPKWILYQLSHQGSPRILEWVAYLFSSGYSRPRNWTEVSCITGGFFTSWATIHSHKTFIEDVGKWDFLEYWIDCWLQHLRRNLIAVSFIFL